MVELPAATLLEGATITEKSKALAPVKFTGKVNNKAPVPEMIPGLETEVKNLISIAKKFTPIFVATGEYPPCIKHAINVLEKGENLPHSGRFMLGTFLLSKCQSIEQIAPLFKNAPDYNERVTLYQLTNLAANSGSGTQYSCPSCQKLTTQNLCFATSECDNIFNPLLIAIKANRIVISYSVYVR